MDVVINDDISHVLWVRNWIDNRYDNMTKQERIEELRPLVKQGDKEAFKEFINLHNELDEERLKNMSDEEFESHNQIRIRHGKEPLTR